MEQFNEKQMEILNGYFDVHEDDTTIELESYTNGGVDMIIYINKKDHFKTDYLTQLQLFADTFDIDEEIDFYRESEQYCRDFTITESIEDFTKYINDIREIIRKLEKSSETGTKKELKTFDVYFTLEQPCVFSVEAENPQDAQEQAEKDLANMTDTELLERIKSAVDFMGTKILRVEEI